VTHENLPRVCSVEEFQALAPRTRLRRTFDQITEYPDHWEQTGWIELTPASVSWIETRTSLELPPDPRYVSPDVVTRWFERTQEVNLCGSAFCLSGWGSVLAGDRFVNHGVVATRETLVDAGNRGAELFGLHSETASWLFDQSRQYGEIAVAVDWLTLDDRNEISEEGYRWTRVDPLPAEDDGPPPNLPDDAFLMYNHESEETDI
jgi:hypothetical protein